MSPIENKEIEVYCVVNRMSRKKVIQVYLY
jgi:hypothetical protein